MLELIKWLSILITLALGLVGLWGVVEGALSPAAACFCVPILITTWYAAGSR